MSVSSRVAVVSLVEIEPSAGIHRSRPPCLVSAAAGEWREREEDDVFEESEMGSPARRDRRAEPGPARSGRHGARAGEGNGLALKSDGTVVAWGCKGIGAGPCTVPSGLSGVTAIAAGGR